MILQDFNFAVRPGWDSWVLESNVGKEQESDSGVLMIEPFLAAA